jgi:hypothetical protein
MLLVMGGFLTAARAKSTAHTFGSALWGDVNVVLNGAKGKYHAMTGQRKPGRIPPAGCPFIFIHGAPIGYVKQVWGSVAEYSLANVF